MRTQLSFFILGYFSIISISLHGMLSKEFLEKKVLKKDIVNEDIGYFRPLLKDIASSCTKGKIHRDDKLLIHADDFCQFLQKYNTHLNNPNNLIPYIVGHQKENNFSFHITTIQRAIKIAKNLINNDDAIVYVERTAYFHLLSTQNIEFIKNEMNVSSVPYDGIIKKTIIDKKNQFSYQYYSNADLKEIEEINAKKIENNNSLSAEPTPTTTPRTTPSCSPDKMEFFPDQIEL